MAEDFRPGEEDRIATQEYVEQARSGRNGRRIMTGLVAVAAVLGLGVVLVYAYNKGRQDGTGAAPPIIQAQEGPFKIRPESPGGMKVPNRDKEVFSRLETDAPAGKVERLLPSPEKPMTPPASPVMSSEELAKMMPSAGSEIPKLPSGSDTSSVLPPPPPPPATASETMSKEVKKLAAKPPAAPAAKPAKKAPTQKRIAAKTPAQKAVSKGKKKSSTGVYRIQMSSLRSQSSVQKSWASLRKRHRDLLGRLSLSIESTTLSGGRGTYHRMQVGPLASRVQANALCANLKKRKQSCIVVKR
jgi:cell division septation protein DedD